MTVNALAVASSGAEAARKRHLVGKRKLGNFGLKKLHKALRALKMAGRADTYLNYHLFFHLLFYFLFEKLVHRSGTYRKEFVSHGNADAFLTFTHTEGSRKFDAAAEIVFGHKPPAVFQPPRGSP